MNFVLPWSKRFFLEIFPAFERASEATRFRLFQLFHGSLSLYLSHAETNFKTNVWDQGNSFLNKGNRAACYFKAHEQDLTGENT